ncbi:hypothetical protein GE09DRAFT_1220166 [Coniochaeta sp. 2T2.1]|nr:hypothetical protein GE09DRAFT_1220166 [Coniochaeta sp. 2T2.1]
MSSPTSTNNHSGSVSSAESSPTSPTGRRRSSNSLFANLTAQKRSEDPASMARRQSMHDARPETGFIGKMWNK